MVDVELDGEGGLELEQPTTTASAGRTHRIRTRSVYARRSLAKPKRSHSCARRLAKPKRSHPVREAGLPAEALTLRCAKAGSVLAAFLRIKEVEVCAHS